MNTYILSRESFLIKHLNDISSLNNTTMSDILESMGIVEQSLLDVIDAKPIEIAEFLGNDEEFEEYDMDILLNTNILTKTLEEKGFKHTRVENSEDYETFLLSPIKYVLIYDKNSSELDTPVYMFIQNFVTTEQKWSKIKLYKIEGDFNRFYDKLSSRTIELELDDKRYIYSTSIKNEWELNNTEPNDTFPKFIRNDELYGLIRSNNIKIKLMA